MRPRSASQPWFGNLRIDDRRFEFAHDIQLFEVANGMKVALIRDDRTNLITVDMRYQVGRAEDPPGRAGMAHLVEHLLFEGRATPGGPTLANLLSDRSLFHNARTRPDETHYTATAPADNLGELLALEARRMRFTCDQLDQVTFARERDVVLSEEAERTGRRFAVGRALYEAVYGADHPYTRAMIRGEVAAATREEVCAFIATHYTPERAILVVSGPIDPAHASSLIGSAFGPIGRGRGVRMPLPLARRGRSSSNHTGAVDHPTVVVAFPSPPWGADGRQIADLVDKQLANAVKEAAAGQSWIRGTALLHMGDHRAPTTAVVIELRDAGLASAASDLVFAAVAKLAGSGVSERTLERRVGEQSLRVVAAWDRLGARGAWTADYLQYTDHRWFMLKDLAELRRLGLAELRGRATELAANAHVAVVLPIDRAAREGALTLPELQSHDLQPWRTPVDPAEAQRPLAVAPARLSDRTTAFELDNGLRVVLAPDPHSPIVDVRLVFPAGAAHEPRDRPGLAAAAAYLLDHDRDGLYQRRDAVRIRWAVQRGTLLDTDVDETTTTFLARGLGNYSEWHLWRLAWLIDQGIYDKAAIAALHATLRKPSDGDRDRTPAVDHTAPRFRERLFGAGHPYAAPRNDARLMLRIGKQELQRWRRGHYRARGATLIVSGGFPPDAMRRIVTELFGRWSGNSPAGLPPVPRPTPHSAASWLAIRDETLAQARLTIAFLSGSEPVRDEAARAVLALIVDDRLRLVREGMGASYGVTAQYALGARGGALVIGGQVDTARTADVLDRVLAELAAVRGGGGTFDADFVRARRHALATALAYTGGASATARAIEDVAARALALDHAAAIAEQIARLTPAQVRALAAADLAADRMVVQVAGKRAAVDAAFAKIGVTPE